MHAYDAYTLLMQEANVPLPPFGKSMTDWQLWGNAIFNRLQLSADNTLQIGAETVNSDTGLPSEFALTSAVTGADVTAISKVASSTYTIASSSSNSAPQQQYSVVLSPPRVAEFFLRY
jgi:hypothetical protein